MRCSRWLVIAVIWGSAILGVAPTVLAQVPASLDTTNTQRLDDLDQKIRILARRWELEQESAAAKAKETPLLGAGKDGFLLKSTDGKFLLKLRGYSQTDGRFFTSDEEQRNTNTFWLRRIRPIFEGTLQQYFDFTIMPDFGEGKTVLQDAYLDIHFWPQARLRLGKFKEPFGLERLHSGANLLFVERALPNNLVPNRDVGVQLHGELLRGVLSYAVGVFNGVADGASADYDNNDAKDFVSRIFVQPFRNTAAEFLQGLGAGVAGSLGDQQGNPTSPNLPVFKTPAQQSFFSYRSDGTANGTTIASGERSRLSPQGYYYWGAFGLLGEYVLSSQKVAKGSALTELKNEAWQIAASYVLSGQKVSYKGVSLSKPFDPKENHWGAFELAARLSKLSLDKDAFPAFADPAKVAQAAMAWAVGINWYLSKNVKFVVNYERADFDGGAVTGDRKPEKAILGRCQMSY